MTLLEYVLITLLLVVCMLLLLFAWTVQQVFSAPKRRTPNRIQTLGKRVTTYIRSQLTKE
jgi:hypothetical protein